MSTRFFSAEPISTDRVTLGGAEAHHLLHVMRAAPGTPVTLFDNSGAEYAAVVETLARSTVELRIVERQPVDRELPFSLTLGVALPKGDRQKWLVEKLTELGVTRLVPLVTERGVAQPAATAAEKLVRAVVEAAKQCGRNRLLELAQPQTWNEWVTREAEGNVRRLVAHPAGISLTELDLRHPLTTEVAIGPEGGLTEAEVAMARTAGWQLVDLGPRILRVETAAVALTAAVILAAPANQTPPSTH